MAERTSLVRFWTSPLHFGTRIDLVTGGDGWSSTWAVGSGWRCEGQSCSTNISDFFYFQLLYWVIKSYAINDPFNVVVFFSFFFLPLIGLTLLKIGDLLGEDSIHEVIKTLSTLIKSKASKSFELVFSVFMITSLIISSLL